MRTVLQRTQLPHPPVSSLTLIGIEKDYANAGHFHDAPRLVSEAKGPDDARRE